MTDDSPAASIVPAAPAAARVLLVEDNAMVRDSMSELIEAFGHAVASVEDAEQAIDALTQSAGGYDVLISDVSLPKMSGLELVRHAHARYPQMRLVLATGYGDLIDGSRLGVPVAVLPKPLDIDRLASFLDEVATARRDGA